MVLTQIHIQHVNSDGTCIAAIVVVSRENRHYAGTIFVDEGQEYGVVPYYSGGTAAPTVCIDRNVVFRGIVSIIGWTGIIQ